MRKVENNWNTTIIKTASKTHRQMLKLVGKSLSRNRIFVQSQSISSHPLMMFSNHKGQSSTFIVEKPSRCHRYQVIKINFTSNAYQHNLICPGKDTSSLWYPSQWLQYNYKKTSGKLGLKDILQHNSSVLFKSVKIMKDKEKL